MAGVIGEVNKASSTHGKAWRPLLRAIRATSTKNYTAKAIRRIIPARARHKNRISLLSITLHFRFLHRQPIGEV